MVSYAALLTSWAFTGSWGFESPLLRCFWRGKPTGGGDSLEMSWALVGLCGFDSRSLRKRGDRLDSCREVCPNAPTKEDQADRLTAADLKSAEAE